jgi:hypothetical protein
MSDQEFYPTDVTDGEAAFGFQLALVSNPRRVYAGHPSLIRAVIYVVGPMDQIVKTRDPDGNIEYSHRQYGDRGLGDQPEWNPVLVPVPSASDAIRIARKKVDEELAHRSGLTIDPVFPSLALHCQACDHEFSLTKDFVGVTEAVACPACKKTDSASNMISYDSDLA